MPQPADKPLLILDLDETLIFATSKALDIAPHFSAGPHAVYKRPFLDQFLELVAIEFQLAVWSSSTADYVAAITSQIIPSNIALQFEWSRSRCVQRYDPNWQDTYWIKDLKKVARLGYDLKRALIVDDTPKKLERNYGNAVYINPFEGDPSDQELSRLAPFLLSLAGRDDLRTIEKRGWRSRT